uniref:Uncharacterized protein n=1 Tax=Parascaris univalens TaxID=6257 RepID=A0A915B3W6_PARUN
MCPICTPAPSIKSNKKNIRQDSLTLKTKERMDSSIVLRFTSNKLGIPTKTKLKRHFKRLNSYGYYHLPCVMIRQTAYFMKHDKIR